MGNGEWVTGEILIPNHHRVNFVESVLIFVIPILDQNRLFFSFGLTL